MNETTAITRRSFAMLTTFFMIGTSILITPSALAHEAKQDAWIACLIGVGFNILNALLYVLLGDRLAGRTLVQHCEAVLGKWLGKAVSAVFALFFYLLASLMVGDLGYFLTSQIMPDTPIEVLQMLFVFVVIMTVRSGVTVYSRAAELFFPWLILLFLILILPLIPKFNLRNLLPVMEFGVKPWFRGAFSFYGLQEMVVMLMFYPLMKQGAGRGKAFVSGILVGGAILLVTTIGSIAVLGPGLTANQLFPAYTLAKSISIGHFLERVEGLMISIWVLSIFVKIILTFHAALLGIVQVAGIKDEKPLVAPLGVGMIVLALMCYPNTIYINEYLSKNWAPFALLFTLLLPLLLLAASAIPRRKRGEADVERAD